MNRPALLTLLAVIFIVASVASGDDSSSVSVPTSSATEGPSILNLAVGDYWIYLDSCWETGTVEVAYDTFKVVDYEEDSAGNWWVLNQPMFDLGTRLMIKGDSLYTRQYCWGPPCKQREYIPPVDQPFRYHVVKGGDMVDERVVSVVDTAITVPAGTFEGVWKYDFQAFCRRGAVEYFKPGLGFIYVEKPCFDTDIDLPMKHSWLVEYEVGE